MKTLDLYRIWEILNIIKTKELELEEKGEYFNLLGGGNFYLDMSFDDFIDHYSFKIEEDTLLVYNDSPVPYEDYTNNDFNAIPTCLLSMTDGETNEWLDDKVELSRKNNEERRLKDIEYVKYEIQRLQKRLEDLTFC